MNFVYYLHDEKSVEQFEQSLLWFKDRYNLVSYQDIYDSIYNGKKLKNACHLTVDDGWRSTYDIIFPIIKKYNVPITIFVSPQSVKTGLNFWYKQADFCDETKVKEYLIRKGYFKEGIIQYPLELVLKEMRVDDVYRTLSQESLIVTPPHRCFMNEKELLEMAGSELVNIGAHTLTHPILLNETDARVEKEIKDSVRQLEVILNREIDSFAYPNGLRNEDFGEREIKFAAEAGLKTCFTVHPGWLKKSTNPLLIPRVGSTSRLKLGKLGCMLPSRTNQSGMRKIIRNCKING